MPVYGLQQGRRRSLIRNAQGNNWTDCIVWRRNDAGTGWNRVHSGLVIVQPSGSGVTQRFANEPAPGSAPVVNTTAGVQTLEGYGPFSYNWTRISGSAAMTIDDAAAAFPIFRATVPKNVGVSSTWRCSVYDAMTGRTVTLDRQISLEYYTNL